MSGQMSRALILEHFGELPRLVERPVPAASPGQTLVRMLATQVAHLDLNVVDGKFGILPDLPAVPGTNGAGIVLASDRHQEGTLVRVNGKGLGLRWDGCWADHAVVPDAAVIAVPEGTDPALACSFFTPVGTAWAAVHPVAAVQPGERVLVTGAAGAVGSLTVQIAARAGAEVIGVVGRASKLSHVPAPAKAVLATEMSPEAVGGQIDAVVDTVGGSVLRDALGLVRPRGRVALVGYTAGREFTVDLADFLLADVSLLPVNLMTRGKEVAADAERLLTELAAGQLNLPIERYGPDRLTEAVERLRTGAAVGRVVLDLA
ncbi:zinc-binding alcohol dehydrogenase family protein [Streptomyces montanus]|uniref:Zinc-binding alcohol dehydrogenase family protein n=1 Tax=Streptomyces montanus TaxID=2580423 RepID=A0A5R9G5H0_9ACTN|nr:zinc-binding alcohol dehydrogenase family protein [Streptomyces montanus]TLS48023.1 zinc-binding alcohol dehydrogenase family protein [Streptomyces montanus]